MLSAQRRFPLPLALNLRAKKASFRDLGRPATGARKLRRRSPPTGPRLARRTPSASAPRPYGSATNKHLWDAYAGTCASLAIFFEWPTGASSADHFIAKSRIAVDAYEWANYRLACLGANRAKDAFSDILDPIGLPPDTFFLNLSNGRIRPMRGLPPALARAAQNTIRRLKLDREENRKMRARHYIDYLRHKGPATLKFYTPSVWFEAGRQGLL